MTIKVIWKVEGDRNEYETEQQAQIAECLQGDGTYLTQGEKLFITKAITEKYFLSPILKTETVQTEDILKLSGNMREIAIDNPDYRGPQS